MIDLLLSDSSLPSKDELARSLGTFIDRSLRFYYANGETDKITLNEGELDDAIVSAFDYVSHYKGPNCFKVAAAFILALSSKKPFKTPLQKTFDPIQGEQNIVLGIVESLYWLYGIKLATKEGTKKITKPICFTDHQFCELVQTISLACQNFQCNFDEADDRSKISLIALIIEAVSYKTNDHIPYQNNPLMKLISAYFDRGLGI